MFWKKKKVVKSERFVYEVRKYNVRKATIRYVTKEGHIAEEVVYGNIDQHVSCNHEIFPPHVQDVMDGVVGNHIYWKTNGNGNQGIIFQDINGVYHYDQSYKNATVTSVEDHWIDYNEVVKVEIIDVET